MESPEKVSFDDRGLGFWILGIILVLLLFFLIFAFIASGSCGIDLFIGIPLSVGILAAFTRSIYKRVTPGEIFLITAYLGAVLLLGFLFVREESLVCLLMSIPITYLPLLIGAWIGYKIQNKNWSKYLVVPIVLFFNISAHVFDRLDVESQRNVIKTTIVVRSSSQKVWKRILSPFEFGEAVKFFLSQRSSISDFHEGRNNIRSPHVRMRIYKRKDFGYNRRVYRRCADEICISDATGHDARDLLWGV